MLKYLLYSLFFVLSIFIILSFIFKKDCQYSDWSICSDNKQIRSIISPSSLFGSCKNILEQSCISTPTSKPTTPTPISSKPILYLKTEYSRNINGYKASFLKDGEYKPIMDFIGVPENSDNYFNYSTGSYNFIGKVKFIRHPLFSDSVFVIKNDDTQENLGKLGFEFDNMEDRKNTMNNFKTTWKNIDLYNYIYL